MNEQTSVLVVDDNEDLAQTFSMILKRRGFDVDVAQDGACAVDKFKSRHYDVTLMDIVMPVMNGVEAFRRMKQLDPQAKVILMTAYYDDAELQTAIEEGVYSAIHKPTGIEQIIELIKAAANAGAILIVDDDNDICQTMKQTLEIEGYRVLAVNSGEEAIAVAEEKGCRLAFVDMKLPLMDGLETCLKLKEVNSGIMVIMMTGYGEEVRDRLDKALTDSAVTCLYKPFNPLEAVGITAQIIEQTSHAGKGNDREKQYISC